MDLVILIGLQGSGKTTFYQNILAALACVSKDRLRNNRRPARRQLQLLEDLLRTGRSVVVDNTNPTAADRAPLIALGRAFGAQVIGYWFESPIEDCLNRNRERTGKARVPDVALYATQKRLEPPTPAEGFDRLFCVRPLDDGRFEVRDWENEPPSKISETSSGKNA